jgi:4-hydroxy-tetrahydrodipicolinate reductase
MTAATSSTHTLIVHGGAGKLGSRIIALSRTRRDLAAIFAVVRPNSAPPANTDPIAHARFVLAQDIAPPATHPVVIIDVTSDEGTQRAIEIAREISGKNFRAALLVCTTGLSDRTLTDLKALAARHAVMHTPNTSLGVAAVCAAATLLARSLGPEYRPAIIEAHHDQKKDAPSGTAKRLATALSAGGTPVPGENIFAIRAGDVIGEHTIRLTGPGEVIELTHRATTRDLFARGALALSSWLATLPPGWYSMDQFIAARSESSATGR